MLQVLGTLIAFAAAGAFVWTIWSISQALMRRGIVVRPVSMMDARMTEIERRHTVNAARNDTTAKE
ncbi:MAG: hypothetical protein B7Y86_00870 [Brevundimonas subvibrioides]|uniref:Uncharacterized protein n=1 Tax=Brevundimonas subvibrioides TaxID=74313 RepID=A0A258HQX4_9CAUL|nr:hypothetical protein [Brevundimonas subvibrioides]OYX59014.1 MAG: hypothetical protein B7Y86_00870 [Brevundimonas subvibrioides]